MNRPSAQILTEAIKAEADALERTVNIMEICGTHTVSLFRSGVKSLMPEKVNLLSGPGCPVCVTPQNYIDAACALASRPDLTVCTYGDMIRVPGEGGSLAQRRADGADTMVCYSATDALRFAKENPDKQIVFLAVGFETTAPATAAVVKQAKKLGLTNFSVFVSHKLVIPALDALLAAEDVKIDGFLCPGHVSVIIGSDAYKPVTIDYHKPCVIAGFEPTQMLEGILHVLQQIKQKDAEIDNVYGVAVSPAGNTVAWDCIEEVFEPIDAEWRAIGVIPKSGLGLRAEYAEFDAVVKHGITLAESVESQGCKCGEIIQGKLTPQDCQLFGKACTPTKPIGPCMVSSEGTCAAYYKYGRN